MESVKETVKICVCKGGAWERVDEAVSERLEIDANSDFMVTYNLDNDIVEDPQSDSANRKLKHVVGSPKNKKSNERDLLDDEKLRPFGENIIGIASCRAQYTCIDPFGDDNAVRIIPGPAGILQLALLRKISEIREGGHNGEMSTQEYVRKITEEASEDDHFTRGPWLSAIQYLAAEGSITTGCFGDMKTFIKNGKLEKVVAVIKSCTPNMLGELTVTLKDLSSVISGTIHYKVLNDEVYGKAISVGAVLILRNVLVFSQAVYKKFKFDVPTDRAELTDVSESSDGERMFDQPNEKGNIRPFVFDTCQNFGQQEGIVALIARRSRLHPGTQYLAKGNSGELEAPISRDEIRRAVWDCGENKSPGRTVLPLNSFADSGISPISLIGSIYKVVTKILANRLSTVIADIISNVLKAATLIGCSVLHTPFKYLGIMVGENMSSIRAWDETVNKLKLRLSSWKLKTLSIGGRLTLLKSVLGSTPFYNMSLFKVPKAVLKSMESIRRKFFNGIRDGEKKIAWVSWSKVLASKSNGGLGVSSFYALNRGLLFKWI
nr:RNA-directed DNA polymerase, eukaryota [Tanacetum cinerariifolium]